MAAHLSEQRDLELRGCVEHLKAEHEIGAGLRAHQQRKLRSQIRAEKHGTQAGTQVEQRTRHIVARTVLTPAAAEWKSAVNGAAKTPRLRAAKAIAAAPFGTKLSACNRPSSVS